jgi:hypothetical protein
MACIAMLHSPSASGQTCSGRDLTSTPAPPPNSRSYELYLKQLNSIVSAEVDLVLLGDSLAEYWDTKTLQPMTVRESGRSGRYDTECTLAVRDG